MTTPSYSEAVKRFHAGDNDGGTAILSARNAANREAARTRLAKACEARALRREVGIRTDAELLTELNHILSCIEFAGAGTRMREYKARLLELATDLDSEVPQDFIRRASPAELEAAMDGRGA